MRPMRSHRWLAALWIGLIGAPGCAQPAGIAPAIARREPPPYEYRAEHDPNGTGKFFLGREIAQVMGHQGADWLERPERLQEERPDLLLSLLGLQPGQTVADIGAGTGYHTWRLAQAVGTNGLVYAVDIQPEMLDLLRRQMAARGIGNVRGILGTEAHPNLPTNAVDLALLVDVYHEFSRPYEMIEALCRSLKPGGRLVLVEFRAEDPEVPIKAVHKMSEAQVRREMALHPLEHVETIGKLPWQHVLVFRRRPDGAAGAQSLPP